MTAFPVYFAGVADVTGGTEVVQVGNQADLLLVEAEISPGKWKLFPFKSGNQASANAAEAAAEAWAKAPAGVQPGNPATGVAKAATGAVGSILGLPQLSHTRDLVVRAMKVIVGAVLLLIGLAELSGVSREALPVIGAAAKAVPV
jgi:hypothetical protein